MAVINSKAYSTGWGADAVTIPAGTVTYAGAVLKTGSETVRIMSDVWADGYYALVWTGTAVAKVSTGNSEFGSDDTVTVDATPDVVAAANAWLLAKEVATLKSAHAEGISRMVANAKVVATGKTVTVVKGRKVAKGTTGDVFWMGHGAYGVRVGLKDAAGTVHWTAASNVEVTNPDEHMDLDYALTPLDEAALVAEATARLNEATARLNSTAGWYRVAASAAAA